MGISIAEIRSRLLIALTSELGAYTFRDAAGNVTTVPALQIETGTYKIIDGKVVNLKPEISGLEVIIRPEISSDYRPLLALQYQVSHNTDIILKQWAKDDTTQTARAMMLLEFGGLIDRIGPRITRVSELDNLESQTFTIVIPSSS